MHEFHLITIKLEQNWLVRLVLIEMYVGQSSESCNANRITLLKMKVSFGRPSTWRPRNNGCLQKLTFAHLLIQRLIKWFFFFFLDACFYFMLHIHHNHTQKLLFTGFLNQYDISLSHKGTSHYQYFPWWRFLDPGFQSFIHLLCQALSDKGHGGVWSQSHHALQHAGRVTPCWAGASESQDSKTKLDNISKLCPERFLKIHLQSLSVHVLMYYYYYYY